MDAEYESDYRTLEPHLTCYATDTNLSAAHRAEARRILALEAALSVAKSPTGVVKLARDVEAYLRGPVRVAD